MWTKAVVENVEMSGRFPVRDLMTKGAFMEAASSLLATKQEMYYINSNSDFIHQFAVNE